MLEAPGLFSSLIIHTRSEFQKHRVSETRSVGRVSEHLPSTQKDYTNCQPIIIYKKRITVLAVFSEYDQTFEWSSDRRTHRRLYCKRN